MSWLDLLSFSAVPTQPHVGPTSAVVALGGGGARGLAHLGAIEAVLEAGIQIDRLVGVSMGALVGALCAIEPNVQRVQSKAMEFLHSPEFLQHQGELFGSAGVSADEASSGIMAWYERAKYLYSAHRRLTRAATSKALLADSMLTESINQLIPDIDFHDLSVPLSVVAADLRSGHRIVLENGSVRQAVHASMALPGIFPPVDYGDMLLCDIGVVDSLPTAVARSYDAEITIAVDVGQHPSLAESLDNAIDVMMRMQDIGEQILRREKTELADIHIHPALGDVSWFDFRKPREIIDRGRITSRQELRRFMDQRHGSTSGRFQRSA